VFAKFSFVYRRTRRSQFLEIEIGVGAAVQPILLPVMAFVARVSTVAWA
jgi:hypothetical protein